LEPCIKATGSVEKFIGPTLFVTSDFNISNSPNNGSSANYFNLSVSQTGLNLRGDAVGGVDGLETGDVVNFELWVPSHWAAAQNGLFALTQNKDFNFLSLSARDYRKLSIKNKNIVKLGELLETKHKVGKEICSESYLTKSYHRFLKTFNISKNFRDCFIQVRIIFSFGLYIYKKFTWEDEKTFFENRLFATKFSFFICNF
jgi:hypothetical protein